MLTIWKRNIAHLLHAAATKPPPFSSLELVIAKGRRDRRNSRWILWQEKGWNEYRWQWLQEICHDNQGQKSHIRSHQFFGFSCSHHIILAVLLVTIMPLFVDFGGNISIALTIMNQSDLVDLHYNLPWVQYWVCWLDLAFDGRWSHHVAATSSISLIHVANLCKFWSNNSNTISE